MPVTQEQFYLQHQDADGNLSPEHAAQLLELPVQGDTPAQAAGSSDKPAVASEPAAAEGTAKPADEPKPAEVADPAKSDVPAPVVLAKDGVHTIPYEELVQAREAAKTAKHWEDVAAQQAAELEALKKAPAPAAAPAEVPKIDAAKAAELFGDFSEEAIAKGVETLVAQRVEAATVALESKFQQALAPVQANAEKTALETHYKTIYTAHPDTDSLVESAELKAFIEQQPSFVRDQYKAVLTEGTADQVVELFTTFKSATAKPAPAPAPKPAVDAEAKAAEVIASAKAPKPMSLSDIPAGSQAHHDEATAVLEMTPEALLGKFEKLSPSQTEALLNRVL